MPTAYPSGGRLVIKEFTFFMSNHICLGDQASDEIEVGFQITLKREVSPFGTSADHVVGIRKGGNTFSASTERIT